MTAFFVLNDIGSKIGEKIGLYWRRKPITYFHGRRISAGHYELLKRF